MVVASICRAALDGAFTAMAISAAGGRNKKAVLRQCLQQIFAVLYRKYEIVGQNGNGVFHYAASNSSFFLDYITRPRVLQECDNICVQQKIKFPRELLCVKVLQDASICDTI